ncbi:MAG: signal peptidase I [Eggerthellaceae bacterium]|nr:signal peptidase I [Eggerthellaceae bacterium]
MAYGEHAKEENPGVFSILLSFLFMVAVVFAAAWLLRTFVIAPYQIPSASMETTIMVSDKLFSEKVSYYFRSPTPGEIVTFDDPEVEDRTLIKRCIAVGGQTVDLRDGAVYVDDVRLDEPYTNGQSSHPLGTAPGVEISYPYTIPSGYLWVMGDNRTNSADSRYFGPVPESSVTGHACLIYWPINRIGVFG